jgi:amino acid transporter
MDSVIAPERMEAAPHPGSFGLRPQVLSPLETLAQSVSAIAPSTSAALTVPLVFGLAGEGACLAYGIAMLGMVLVALCIVTFARDSASPGSLYVYARATLSPSLAALTAWALCFAYLMTASSVLGGFLWFAYGFLGPYGHLIPPAALAALAGATAVWVAYRDVQISAQVMLWTEAVSVSLICFVVAMTLWRHGFHIDLPQIRLRGASPTGIRLGVMLAVFSFVGFESATSLGSEAKNPLQTIPRAVIWSALLSGLFFIGSAYGEVLGFRGSNPGLAENTAPMRFLAAKAGIGIVGPVIDLGVLVSMFAATLACVIAAARLLMLMSRHGMVGVALGRTNARHGTPALAGMLAGFAAFLPAAILAQRGASGADIYGWMGSLAVFGFLTAYGLVAFATMVHRGRQQRLGVRNVALGVAGTLAMVAALLGTLFPVPPAPYRYLPYVYGAFLLGALTWDFASRRRARPQPA